MGYKKAQDALPHHLLCAIQEYIEGETLYIPKKEANKLSWGAKTQTRETIRARNRDIIAQYRDGSTGHRAGPTVFPVCQNDIQIISAEKTAEKTNEAPGETPALFLFPNEKEDAFALASPYTVSR